MNYYLVRHGEIEANVKKIYAGWSEEGLTPKGIDQAKRAGEELSGVGVNAIYCSPLRRAVQTAEIIGEFLNKEPIVENSFKELKLGIWEGMSEEDVAIRFPEEWKIWNERPADLILEDSETLKELLERVLGGIENIRAREKKDSCVLIVTHVAIIRVLLLYTKKMDLNLYRTIPVPNGGVFVIRY